jgi:hypothetical protein
MAIEALVVLEGCGVSTPADKSFCILFSVFTFERKINVRVLYTNS